jgi:hypothetical protein
MLRCIPFATAWACTAALASAQTLLHEVVGQAQGERQGDRVILLGDVDGDGGADWACARSPVMGGIKTEIRVISGGTGNTIRVIQPGSLTDALYMHSLANAGDVDLDGVDDIVMGVTNDDDTNNVQNCGSVWVHSGATGQELWHNFGQAAFLELGVAVAGIGDVDGDGHADIAAGQKNTNSVHVYSGKFGLPLYSLSLGSGFGRAIAPVGDVNLDGNPDFVVGAPNSTWAKVLSGPNGAELLHLQPTTPTTSFGSSVAGVGDVNLDGVPDILVGAPFAGGARLCSGANGAALADFVGTHPLDRMGSAVTAAGDIDDDGVPDFAIGAPQNENVGAGYVSLISGRTLKTLEVLTGNELGDRFGASIAGGGNVNGDGLPELVVGAPDANTTQHLDAGRAELFSPCPLPFQTYCTAKLNSQGCLPLIAAQGDTSLAGPDDLVISATFVLNNQNGIFFWGPSPASAPFLGGTLCMGPPLIRTASQSSGGNPPQVLDCSGSYSFAFTHAYASSFLLGAGSSVFGQFWSRDPGLTPPNNVGLTNAIQFTLWLH